MTRSSLIFAVVISWCVQSLQGHAVDATGNTSLAKRAFSSTTFESYLTRDGNFEIRFTREGIEAVAGAAEVGPNEIPEYVLQAEAALARSWRLIVDTLGYPRPKACLDRAQISKRYLVELREPGFVLPAYEGAYGLTIQCERGKSFMVVENDFRKYVNGHFHDFVAQTGHGEVLQNYAHNPKSGLEVTIAHEFFHSIQFAMTGRIAGFWTEASAVYMEERIYPEHNDYLQYLPHAIHSPEVSLHNRPSLYDLEGNLRQYGQGIWAQHLAKCYGDAAIRRSWEILASRSASTSTLFHRLLEKEAGGIEKAFSGYALAQFFSGSRYDSTFSLFSDAPKFPDLPIREKIRGDEPHDLRLKPLSFTVRSLENRHRGPIQIRFGEATHPLWSALVIQRAAEDPGSGWAVSVVSDGMSPTPNAFINGREGEDSYLILCNLSTNDDMGLTLDLSPVQPATRFLPSRSLPWQGAYHRPHWGNRYQFFDLRRETPLFFPKLWSQNQETKKLLIWKQGDSHWNPSTFSHLQSPHMSLKELPTGSSGFIATEQVAPYAEESRGRGGAYGYLILQRDGKQALLRQPILDFKTLLGRGGRVNIQGQWRSQGPESSLRGVFPATHAGERLLPSGAVSFPPLP